MREMKSLLRPPITSTSRGWVIVAVLLICCAGMVYRSLEMKRLLAGATVARERLEQESRTREHAASRLSPEQMRHWQALDAEMTFPWEDIFQLLEGATSEDIELLEMAPDKAHRSLVLRGEARDVGATMSYVQSLARHHGVGDAFVSRMRRVERVGLQTVEFEIKMSLQTSAAARE